MPRASDLVKEMNKKSVDFDQIMILCFLFALMLD